MTRRVPLLILILLLVVVGCSKPQPDSNNPAPIATAQSVTPAASSTPATATAVVTATANATATTAAAAPPPMTKAAAGRPREGCEGLFDPPQGAIKLCDEHVLADKSEIHWTSWSVTTSRMDAFDPYRKHAGECKMGATFKPPILSISNNADMRLSIHDVTETGFPSCSVKPGPEAKSVIVISRKRDH